jgi:GntR family transcriptional regulator / MocR family aminotransferase
MAGSRTSSIVELLVEVDRDASVPLYRQLEQSVRDAVRSGRLHTDAPVPSTRALAGQLGVTRGVVVSAYEQLVAEGYLVSRPGGSTRVGRVPGGPAAAPASVADTPYHYDFRPGRPDVTEFPRGAWLRSLRRVLGAAPAHRLGYLDGRGMPELRTALAAYLNRARGTCGAADDIVVSTGFAQGLQLVARTLRVAGARRIAVEDPWHPEYRAMLMEAGLEVVPIPVDGSGIIVDRLEEAGAAAVVVTPAHQYPTGAVLTPARRTALVAWADRHDATIIEDDYDAEFRYDRDPIGAMQGLGAERVVYAGTASKILAPGLRLGWLLTPRRLRDALARVKVAADQGSSALDQLAMADFVEHGELDRHLRRMRGVYRRRRDALLAAIAAHLPGWRPIGTSAGLHVLAWLPEGVDQDRSVRVAGEAGIGLHPVSTAFASGVSLPGVVFGYGAVPERRIEEGIARLASLSPRR